MPRLTNAVYLDQRALLVREWDHADGHFARLSVMDQFALHRFFGPFIQMSDHEALQYRFKITSAEPSLPSKAGKAFVRFSTALTTPRPVAFRKVKGVKRDYHVRVEGLVRPDIDFDKLARALLAFAKEKVDHERRNS